MQFFHVVKNKARATIIISIKGTVVSHRTSVSVAACSRSRPKGRVHLGILVGCRGMWLVQLPDSDRIRLSSLKASQRCSRGIASKAPVRSRKSWQPPYTRGFCSRPFPAVLASYFQRASGVWTSRTWAVTREMASHAPRPGM